MIRVDEFVTKHKIDCEWTPRPTYDVCMTGEFLQYEAKALETLLEAGGEPDGFSILDGPTSREVRQLSI